MHASHIHQIHCSMPVSHSLSYAWQPSLPIKPSITIPILTMHAWPPITPSKPVLLVSCTWTLPHHLPKKFFFTVWGAWKAHLGKTCFIFRLPFRFDSQVSMYDHRWCCCLLLVYAWMVAVFSSCQICIYIAQCSKHLTVRTNGFFLVRLQGDDSF